MMKEVKLESEKNNQLIINLKAICKCYCMKKKNVNVLVNLNAEFYNSKFYVIKGHSGSGKSTLINILGLIDSSNSGEYFLLGKLVSNLKKNELAELRMKNIGFIFQDFNLNQNLKAYENVMIPMLINKEINHNEIKPRSISLLSSVKLQDRVEHYPKELSGGEQQRVAIARALSNNPQIILADEPTGNLDKESEKMIFEQLRILANQGKCVIVVSHSDYALKYADIVYELDEGKLVECNDR